MWYDCVWRYLFRRLVQLVLGRSVRYVGAYWFMRLVQLVGVPLVFVLVRGLGWLAVCGRGVRW